VEAIRVSGDSGAATVERRISVCGNLIDVADKSTSDNGAVRWLPNNGATTFQDCRMEDNTINDCGSCGVRFAAGVYTYFRLSRNKVRDPAQAVASRAAFRWDSSVTWVGNFITDNEARQDNGTNMNYGFDNASSANIQSTDISGNHSRGHATAPGYNNMQHSSNSRSANRAGDNALNGTLSLTAAASFTIGNSNAQAGMRVDIYPTNASAAVLMNGTKMLYFDGTIVAGTSFTLKTADGTNAAGTETLEYSISV
jgi:ribosomal protein S14